MIMTQLFCLFRPSVILSLTPPCLRCGIAYGVGTQKALPGSPLLGFSLIASFTSCLYIPRLVCSGVVSKPRKSFGFHGDSDGSVSQGVRHVSKSIKLGSLKAKHGQRYSMTTLAVHIRIVLLCCARQVYFS